MLAREIRYLRRAEGDRIGVEAEKQDKKRFNPWDGNDLIKKRVLEHYDEEGYAGAPDFILDAAWARFMKRKE